jgi:hypothetical protein
MGLEVRFVFAWMGAPQMEACSSVGSRSDEGIWNRIRSTGLGKLSSWPVLKCGMEKEMERRSIPSKPREGCQQVEKCLVELQGCCKRIDDDVYWGLLQPDGLVALLPDSPKTSGAEVLPALELRLSS